MVAYIAKVFTLRFSFNPLLPIIVMIFFVFISMLCPDQARAGQNVRQPLSYADVADLVSAAPLIAKARIESVKAVKGANISPAEPSRRFTLIAARVESLIRGTHGAPQRVRFLVASHSARNLVESDIKQWRKGTRILIFARTGERPDALQLVSRNGIQPWSTELDTVTRAVTTDILGPRPAPAIVSVGDAFHVAGTVAGESETQIFLRTATGEPVSLSVVHRGGQTPRWGVSLGEIVDDTAEPPTPDTLLWYRLACGLPNALPAASTRGLSVLDAEAARRDYRFVMESLGRCGRTL